MRIAASELEKRSALKIIALSANFGCRSANSLAVSGLGSSTWDVTASGEDARNFRFIGAIGQAGAFALGLAMAQPEKRVVLFTGDGEMLMGLGVLATIANQAPSNLAILVLDINLSQVMRGAVNQAIDVRKGASIGGDLVNDEPIHDLEAGEIQIAWFF